MGRISFGVLAALVVSAPSWALTQPAHFSGALSDDAPRVRNAAVYFDDNGPGEVPLDQLSREQLQAEYRRLEQERPGIGLGIGLAAGGGGAAFLGFLIDVSVLGTYGYTAALIVGTALLIAGGVCITIGLIILFRNIAARRGYGTRMDDINARLDSMDRGAPMNNNLPPPGYDAPPPPPPPPPPPGAMFYNVQPTYALATF